MFSYVIVKGLVTPYVSRVVWEHNRLYTFVRRTPRAPYSPYPKPLKERLEPARRLFQLSYLVFLRLAHDRFDSLNEVAGPDVRKFPAITAFRGEMAMRDDRGARILFFKGKKEGFQGIFLRFSGQGYVKIARQAYPDALGVVSYGVSAFIEVGAGLFSLSSFVYEVMIPQRIAKRAVFTKPYIWVLPVPCVYVLECLI